VTAREEVVELEREVVGLPQPLRPVVGEPGQRRVERVARAVDELGQRRVEVLVLALAEAIAAHVDGRAKAPVLEARGQLAALSVTEHGRCLDEAVLVHARGQGRPVEVLDAAGDGLRRSGAHRR